MEGKEIHISGALVTHLTYRMARSEILAYYVS